jgi:hypothetical protein
MMNSNRLCLVFSAAIKKIEIGVDLALQKAKIKIISVCSAFDDVDKRSERLELFFIYNNCRVIMPRRNGIQVHGFEAKSSRGRARRVHSDTI